MSSVFVDAYRDAWNAGQLRWGVVIVLLVGTMLILANVLRRKIKFFRRLLMPTAVVAGILGLIIKEIIFATTNADYTLVGGYRSYYWYCEYINDLVYSGPIPLTFGILFSQVLTGVIYHALPIAFIALALRDKKDYTQELPKGAKKVRRAGAFKSGSVLVSTYMVQAVIGLSIAIGLFFILPNIFPDALPGAGLFLPIGLGQGPPQSFAMGQTWNRRLNLVGDYAIWHYFALTIAGIGFLVSSIFGVFMLNRIAKRKGIQRSKDHENLTVGDLPPQKFEDANEVPLSESIDKFTLQVCMVVATYLITIGIIFAIDVLVRLTGVAFLIGVVDVFWGFAFLIAMFVGFGVKGVLRKLMKNKVMNRKYPNTYMMNRIAGFAFDISIVCALWLISVAALGWLWIPAILMGILGGVATAMWLRFLTRRLYKDYADEAFLAFFGQLTGTIACGTILTREIDPQFKTPATEDMVIGSAGAVVLGFPLLILVPLAAVGNNFWWMLPALAVYGVLLACFLLNVHKKIFRRRKNEVESSVGEGLPDANDETIETLTQHTIEGINIDNR